MACVKPMSDLICLIYDLLFSSNLRGPEFILSVLNNLPMEKFRRIFRIFKSLKKKLRKRPWTLKKKAARCDSQRILKIHFAKVAVIKVTQNSFQHFPKRRF